MKHDAQLVGKQTCQPEKVQRGSPSERTKPRRGKPRRGSRSNPNFLPASQAESFERELDALVMSLGNQGCYKGDYLLSEFKSKYLDSGLVSPAARERAAIRKWLATERWNRKTNQRIQLGLSGAHRNDDPSELEGDDLGWVKADKLFHTARRLVAEVLGPLNYPQCLCLGGHTNGASTGVKRGPDAAIQKYSGEAHVSTDAVKHWLAYASGAIQASFKLSDQRLRLQENSVLFTVPKATEIDRVACKEPEINMFLQRSIGSHIRKRLRKRNIDLNDQTVNQRLARNALQEGLATLDLSSASDSISKQLVFELLPFDWWCLLSDLRSNYVKVRGHHIELEMFSSMGNGFTFELESLIFWAFLHSIKLLSGCKGKVSVYGDDLIVPRSIAPRVRRTFYWLGFKVNAKKSHWSGGFRESCGKHYYLGRDITPFYVREPVSTKLHVIRLLNRLLEWEGRDLQFIADTEVLAFHKKWSQIIPQSLWGGTDPEDPTALVTGDGPRCRISKRLRGVRKSKAYLSHVARLKKRGLVIDETKLPLSLQPDQWREQETSCLIHWFVTKGLYGRNDLEIDPREDTVHIVQRQPAWAERTTWRPWLLEEPWSTQCTPTP